VRCRVQGYLHGNGIAEQLPDAAVLAEVYARPVERRVDEGFPPSTAVQVLAEPLVQLVQCPFVALKDALCIRRAAIDIMFTRTCNDDGISRSKRKAKGDVRG
jgi:hypothetical protein